MKIHKNIFILQAKKKFKHQSKKAHKREKFIANNILMELFFPYTHARALSLMTFAIIF